MATVTKKTKRKPVRELSDPEPTWEIARLFPSQGKWTEEEFFSLPSNHKIEFCEWLPGFPADTNDLPSIDFEVSLLGTGCVRQGTKTRGSSSSPVTRCEFRTGKYREPDILFIKAQHMSGIGTQYSKKTDLVMEIVSEENRPHDIKKKRVEYARAGIPEYWIVDPEEETITVLTLKPRGKTYTVHGRFVKGTRATSKLLPGFSVDVTTALRRSPSCPSRFAHQVSRWGYSLQPSHQAPVFRVELHNSDGALGRGADVDDPPSVLEGPFLGDVQMSAEMEPGRGCLVRFEEAALTAMFPRRREVGQTDRAGVCDQDIERARSRDPGGGFGHVGIGDIVRLRMRLGPDPTDCRQPDAGDLARYALIQQDRRIIAVPQSGQQVHRIVVSECGVNGCHIEQGCERGLIDVLGVTPIATREDQVGAHAITGMPCRVQITMQITDDQEAHRARSPTSIAIENPTREPRPHGPRSESSCRVCPVLTPSATGLSGSTFKSPHGTPGPGRQGGRRPVTRLVSSSGS